MKKPMYRPPTFWTTTRLVFYSRATRSVTSIRAIREAGRYCTYDPPADGCLLLRNATEALQPDALILHRSEHPFDNSVLFRRIGRDELLTQPIILHHLSVRSGHEDQPIVAAKRQLDLDSRLWTEAADQGVLKSRFGHLGLRIGTIAKSVST